VNLSYTSIHWGTSPDRVTELTAPAGRARSLGELKACSYVTTKDDKANVFRHVFKKFEDEDEGRERGPYLLQTASDGGFDLGGIPAKTIAVGRALDFELINGERFLCAFCYLVTDKEGKHVWLVGPEIDCDIERREDGPIVTIRGIEA